MVEPHSSNFRVITTNVLGVRIFRKFTVITIIFQVSEFSMKSLLSVDPVLQQMVTDYHKRLQSALCHHNSQYQPGGQGHMLDTDVDLLISQTSLHSNFSDLKSDLYDKFEKQSVCSEHNLNNFKNSQPQVNPVAGCHGNQGHHVSRSSLNSSNFIRNQTPFSCILPVQNGQCCGDFDVNAWYDHRCYKEEPLRYGQSNASLAQSK